MEIFLMLYLNYELLKNPDKKHANVYDTKGIFMSRHVATALFSPSSLGPLGTLEGEDFEYSKLFRQLCK